MSRINGFVGRRHFLKIAGLTTLSIGSLTACNEIINNRSEIIIPQKNPNPNPVSATEAQKRLIAGNKRFYNQNRRYPNQTKRRLQSISETQYPYAAILGCADSRVPPELIFDQGLGDLFVVRVAGNIASDEAIGSLEYATTALGTQLIVVLGHKNCGAVAAAIRNKQVPGNIDTIVDGIQPAISENQERDNDTNNDINNDINNNDINNDRDAVISNIQFQTEKMQRSSPILEQLISADRLKIIGAFYDIDTGKVNFL
ncbi:MULTISPECIES: carbonic anhydrase [Sphaerospermopsis]|jgi:carbonic anhydrase|uniref:carbonic anhydrase n=1 Tax=Sphaerospermopsis reniformis TaxID=531300 RepID=A0A479ZZP7_9CYAN|nr:MULTISPECIES: carbonic anhydrase [Sphaerospermopsis]MBD2132451.1 carbonic anhydrase [Sphaerospermopsis sp. FACHB-1094]MBD2145276.1 carbonic anhydrase [Sphaerospermopsis sp. FACHB-1194]GCL36611.1 carbonic anhydrase [Sphaerospermopsis reniformis]